MIRHSFTLLILLTFSLNTWAQTCDESLAKTAPTERFMVEGSEVKDSKTGLTWQRCAIGQSGEHCEEGSATSLKWHEALAHNNDQWRVPTKEELLTIVEKQCEKPAMNLEVFSNAPSSAYWTASADENSESHAWTIAFGSGYEYIFLKFGDWPVRLVRNQ